MTETVYTATVTLDKISGERVLSVDAGTGTLVVACKHGAAWIDMKTYSADAVETIEFGINRIYRFTLTGDATFAL